jgi:hypothetical protein
MTMHTKVTVHTDETVGQPSLLGCLSGWRPLPLGDDSNVIGDGSNVIGNDSNVIGGSLL